MVFNQILETERELFPHIYIPNSVLENLTPFDGVQRLIMLDRYAQKDNKLLTLKEGDVVVTTIKPHPKYPVQGYGRVKEINGDKVTVDIEFPAYEDGVDLDNFVTFKHHISKPVELYWEQIAYRVARGIASVEKTEELRDYWFKKFYWMLSNKYYIPGGRIMYGAGTEYGVTLYNCFQGDTIVRTKQGLKKIRELSGHVEVLSEGGVYRKATFKPYGKQELFRVTLKNGEQFMATAGHEWVVSKPGGYEKVTTTELEGRRVPVVFNGHPDKNDDFYAGVRHGIVYGDGSSQHGESHVVLIGEKKCFAKFFDGYRVNQHYAGKYVRVSGLPLELKTELPSKDASESYWYGFVVGLIGTVGCVNSRGHCMLHSKSLDTLVTIAANLYKTGIVASSIAMTRKLNPFNGEFSPMFKLSFIKQTLCEDDFIKPSHREKFSNSPKSNKIATIKVTSVEETGVVEEVYCCEEPETHTFVIGSGILTGNCFVLGYMKDSRRGIIEHIGLATEIMSRGGGVGSNISTLRPSKAVVRGVNGFSSGSVSWGNYLAQLTHLVEQAGTRRGAQMIGLADWHPDVIEFILCKVQNPMLLDKLTKESHDLRIRQIAESYLKRDFEGNPVGVKDENFMSGANISVLISNDFMKAVEEDADWELRFPDLDSFTAEQKEYYDAHWHEIGDVRKWENLGLPVKPYYTLKARDMWDFIVTCARYSAEPGVIFIDRYNEESNSWYYAPIVITNPCWTGDTRVWTIDGPKTFSEMVSKGITEIDVLSTDEDGKLVYKRMRNIRKTRLNAELVEITFSNGKSLRCTPDHNLYLKDGTKVQANDLKNGDRIFSVYRNANNKGYASLGYQHPDNHVVVSVEFLSYTEDVYNGTVDDHHRYFVFVGDNDAILSANCGEQGLPGFGVCNLGAINLALMFDNGTKDVHWDLLAKVSHIAQRFNDNVIDASFYFLEENEKWAKAERRIGKGVMGLADLMIQLKLPYGSKKMIAKTEEIFKFIAETSYIASTELAAEKGSFPLFDADKYLKSGFVSRLPDHVKQAIRLKGIRNVCSLTVAPTGSTGTMLMVSTGLEPYYAFKFKRKGRLGETEINVPIAQKYFEEHPNAKELPKYFVGAMDISADAHVEVQAAIQKWVDSSLSKTVNAPAWLSVEEAKSIYEKAYALGCKGATIYVDGSRNEQVLSLAEDGEESITEDELNTQDTRVCTISFDEAGNMIKECGTA